MGGVSYALVDLKVLGCKVVRGGEVVKRGEKGVAVWKRHTKFWDGVGFGLES